MWPAARRTHGPSCSAIGYWRERFDADASALGKTIRISGQPVTVIGITPGSFHGVWPGVEPAMYLPLHYMSVISRKDIISPPDSRVGVSGLGRLKPGLSVSDARADLTVHEGRLIDEFEADLPPEIAAASAPAGGVRADRIAHDVPG